MKKKTTMIVTLTIATVSLLIGWAIGKRDSFKEKSTEKIMTNKEDSVKIADRVLNLIILDESGSMSGLEKESVDGVNETFQTIRAEYEKFKEQKQLVTFVTFSRKGDMIYRTKYNLTDIEKVTAFEENDYQPDGTTPLYDTMGKFLTALEKEATDNDIVLVTIITDGRENSSRIYNSEKLHSLISRLDEKNWVFTYIGANQDAILEAQKIGIENAMNYNSDKTGTREMWEKEKKSRSRFMEYARTGTAKERLKRGYFEE